MRVGLMAENPIESAMMVSGIVPLAMLETYSPVSARAITTATKLGIFEALSGVAEGVGAHSAQVNGAGARWRLWAAGRGARRVLGISWHPCIKVLLACGVLTAGGLTRVGR